MGGFQSVAVQKSWLWRRGRVSIYDWDLRGKLIIMQNADFAPREISNYHIERFLPRSTIRFGFLV